jgi:hypothetical protein
LHPERITSRTYVRKLINTFRETVSVANMKNHERPKLNEDVDFEIVADFVEQPQSSTRSVARAIGVYKKKKK